MMQFDKIFQVKRDEKKGDNEVKDKIEKTPEKTPEVGNFITSSLICVYHSD